MKMACSLGLLLILSLFPREAPMAAATRHETVEPVVPLQAHLFPHSQI